MTVAELIERLSRFNPQSTVEVAIPNDLHEVEFFSLNVARVVPFVPDAEFDEAAPVVIELGDTAHG